MIGQTAVIVLLLAVAVTSALPQYGPCYWCGGGHYGGGYHPFPIYGRPGYGAGGSAAASASAASSGGGFGFGGGPASSAASASAAASGSGGFGGYYWDVSGDAAQQVKDKKTACTVLLEQYVEEPLVADALIEFVNKTFFARDVKRNFTLDATPTTFHCCHTVYGNEIRRQVQHKKKQADVVTVKDERYETPILPKGMTCESLIEKLFEDLRRQTGGGDSTTAEPATAVVVA